MTKSSRLLDIMQLEPISTNISERRSRIVGCRLGSDALFRVFDLLKTFADELSNELTNTPDFVREVEKYISDKNLSLDNREAISRLCQVGIVYKSSGVTSISFERDSLKADRLPIPLESIQFEVGLMFRLVASKSLKNNAAVLVDFSRTPMFDVGGITSSPTPNSSEILVAGRTESWITACSQKLEKCFDNYRSGLRWIHRAYMYEWLLVLLGIPFSFFSSSVAGEWVASYTKEQLQTPATLFLFLIALLIFRGLFGLVKWLNPYMELKNSPLPFYVRFRNGLSSLIVTIVLGITATAIYSVMTSP